MRKNWLTIGVFCLLSISLIFCSGLNIFGKDFLNQLIQKKDSNINKLELTITDTSGNPVKLAALSKGEIYTASITAKGNIGEKLSVKIETDDSYNNYNIRQNTDTDKPDIFTLEADTIGTFSYKFIADNAYGAGIQKTIKINISPGLSKHGAAGYNCSFSDTDSELVQEFCMGGVIKGYADGTFKPDNTINRAELVKIIYSLFADSKKLIKLENLAQNSKLSPFIDISSDHWASSYIILGKISGNLSGYSSGLFEGHKDVIRSEAWKIITDAAVSVDITSYELYNEIQSKIPASEPWFESYYAFGKFLNMNTENTEANWKFMGEKISRIEVLEFLHKLFEAIYLKSQ